MNYTVYPPQEVDSALTARAAIAHLGGHFQAFLNTNNISNWAPRDDYSLREDSVADVLVYIGTSKGMTIAQIRYRARKLMRVVSSSGGTMKLSFAYNVIANCLGCAYYRFSYMFRSIDHYVENLWPLGMVNNSSLIEDMEWVSWPSSEVWLRMRENLQFNRIRDGVFKEIKRKKKRNVVKKKTNFL